MSHWFLINDAESRRTRKNNDAEFLGSSRHRTKHEHATSPRAPRRIPQSSRGLLTSLEKPV